ncbi:MAG: trehalose-phosphatase [Candidatus Krumholzibacteria bacterium]|nr:trehalose-phosphatase [Candidatus Krumholzibacteria bacterium]
MHYLFDHLDTLEAILTGRHVLLLLDFDGTLAPIAPTPHEAALPDETRRELERIVDRSVCSVGIISGRALGDIQAKVGVTGITYVGNHGLEIARPDEKPRRIAMPQFHILLDRLKEELAARLATFPGAIIEDKGCSLAVHYRSVEEKDRPRVKQAVHETVGTFGGEREIRLGTGAMVLELRPPISCDKGTIVLSLLRSEARRRVGKSVFAIYLGDDATDEDAFKAIRGRGWGILVGKPRISYAEYYLNDPGEVLTFLRHLVARHGKAI